MQQGFGVKMYPKMIAVCSFWQLLLPRCTRSPITSHSVPLERNSTVRHVHVNCGCGQKSHAVTVMFVRNEHKLALMLTLTLFISVVTTGHETVMAKTTFFGSPGALANGGGFDFTREYPYQEQLVDVGGELSKVKEYNLNRYKY